MTTQTISDLQQLNDTVSRLAAALAASERRYASLASMIRWGASVLLVIVLAAAYLNSSVMAKAFASQMQKGWWERMQEAGADNPPVLDDLMMQLTKTQAIDGMIVKLLQNASSIASREAKTQDCRSIQDHRGNPLEVCFSNAAVKDLGTYFKNENGEVPTYPVDENGKPYQPPVKPSELDPKYRNEDGSLNEDEYKKAMEKYQAELMQYMQRVGPYMKSLMEGTLMAGAQSVVDAAVLFHRLRRDSDFLRTKMFEVGSTDRVLDSIGFELGVMNRALRLVPAMAAEMSVMNRNMSVMSYSMGSTAGRMGSMMPW